MDKVNPVIPIEKAVSAVLDACGTTSIKGASEAMLRVLYDGYGKEAAEVEIRKQLSIRGITL